MVALALLALGLQDPVMPPSVAAHIAVRVGDVAVIAGDANSSTWIYSIKSRTWRRGASMPVPRVFASAVKWKGKVLVMGGMDAQGKHSDRMDIYDPRLNRWSIFGRLPSPMTRTAATVWRGRLLLSGGYNGTSDRQASNSNELLQYDEVDKKWDRLPPMPTPRHGHCLVEFRGRIWAVAGAGNDPYTVGVTESYDPLSKTWRKEHSLGRRIFFGAEVFGGKLVAFGSIEGNPHPFEWSPTGWKERPSAELPRRRFAYIREGDKIIVFGGEPGEPFLVEYRP